MISATLTSVIADLKAREAKGIETYGTTVDRTDLSARDWAQHGYEEALDLTVYMRRLVTDVEDQQKTIDALMARVAQLEECMEEAADTLEAVLLEPASDDDDMRVWVGEQLFHIYELIDQRTKPEKVIDSDEAGHSGVARAADGAAYFAMAGETA